MSSPPCPHRCQTRGEGNRGPERLLLGGLERKPSSTWGSLQPPPPKRDREAAPPNTRCHSLPWWGDPSIQHPSFLKPQRQTRPLFAHHHPLSSPAGPHSPWGSGLALSGPVPLCRLWGRATRLCLSPPLRCHPPHLAASVWVTVTSVLPALALNTAGTRRATGRCLPHPWL